MKDRSKAVVLYHAGCADGFGAALAVKRFYEAFIRPGTEFALRFVPVQYGKGPPALLEHEGRVFIVDFSYPAAALLELARGRSVTVLDHHRTAAADLAPEKFAALGAEVEQTDARTIQVPVGAEGEMFIRFDQEQSGARLAWEWFMPHEKLPRLLEYVEDRDLWRWQLPLSRAVSAGIRSWPMEFERWEAWIADWPLMFNRLVEDGETALRLQEEQVGRIAKEARWRVFDLGRKSIEWSEGPAAREGAVAGISVNTPVLQSEVCERLLAEHPAAELAAAWWETSEGKRVYSLRSRAGFDCSAVARAFGGGGHAQASGFSV